MNMPFLVQTCTEAGARLVADFFCWNFYFRSPTLRRLRGFPLDLVLGFVPGFVLLLGSVGGLGLF